MCGRGTPRGTSALPNKSAANEDSDVENDDDVDDVQAFPDDEDHIVGTLELPAKVVAVQDSFDAHEARLRKRARGTRVSRSEGRIKVDSMCGRAISGTELHPVPGTLSY